MMSNTHQPFKDFVRLSEIQKTLRFLLIPIGKTAQNIEKYNMFEDDEIRHEYYPILKEACDDFYRNHIDQQFENLELDWSKLDEALASEDRDLINETRATYRQVLFNKLKNSVDIKGDSKKNKTLSLESSDKNLGKKKTKNTFQYNFNDLFKAKLIKAILPLYIEYIYEGEKLENAKKALKMYNRFTSRLSNFWQARANIFTDDEISTGSPYRLVNDNFTIFRINNSIYTKNKPFIEEDILEFEKKLKSKKIIKDFESVDDYFTVNAFNKLCTQNGIDKYNSILGGFTTKEREKVKGLNELFNLAQQSINKGKKAEYRKNIRLGKLTKLKKQILAISDSTSFLIEQIEDDQDLYNKIKDFFELLLKEEIENENTFTQYSNLQKLIEQADLSKIYINAKHLNKISHQVTGKWDSLNKGIALLLENININEESKEKSEVISNGQTKDISSEAYKRYLQIQSEEKDIERLRTQIYFSLEDLEKALDLVLIDENMDRSDKSILSYVQSPDLNVNFERDLTDLYSRIMKLEENNEKLLANHSAIDLIKEFLDLIMLRYSRWQILFCDSNYELDQTFYPIYDAVMEILSNIIRLYNLARNYLSRKPDRMKKKKINFNNPTLADGWSESKIPDNSSMLFIKDGMYYLGIIKNRAAYSELLEAESLQSSEKKKSENSSYERMNYHFLPDAFRSIPKSSIAMKAVKEHFEINQKTADLLLDTDKFSKPLRITKEIFDMQYVDLHKNKKKYQVDYLRDTGDKKGYRKALNTWLNFCKDFISKYKGRNLFDYSKIKDADHYETVNEFYNDVDKYSYHIFFTSVAETTVEKFISEGKLYLFQLYNKDFSPHSTGKPNLHTIYWRALFSEENLTSKNIKLNGQAEIFFRPKQIETPFTHKKGSILVNRFDVNGNPIPINVYQEIKGFKNNVIKWDDLNKTTQEGLENDQYLYFESEFEIIKDRRYTEDQLFFHVPISFNWDIGSNPKINDLATQYIVNSNDIHIIGIDRGENHLIYYSVIDLQGAIVEQGSLNTITEYTENKFLNNKTNNLRKIPYKDILQQREDERADARIKWHAIDKIKDLKDGYLGQIVHFLAKLIIKYNAIVILEDLNYGFKRGRFKVERQVYQKFEMALMKKLNVLVFKDYDIDEIGGPLKPWQLTRPIDSYERMGRQNGILFYVPAAYTSAVDPVTGFANLFYLNNVKNSEKFHFFSKFESIKYHSDQDMFSFAFDYNNFGTTTRINDLSKSKWQVFTNHERSVWNNKEKNYVTQNLTDLIKKLLRTYNIEFKNNQNVLDSILKIENNTDKENFARELFRLFRLTIQLRNTTVNENNTEITENELDYIISPVKDKNGNFFDSRDELKNLPDNGDANGAYNIARKGLLYIEQLQESIKTGKLPTLSISTLDWFNYIMK